MVHKIKATLEDVGSGTGAVITGITPVAMYPALFGSVDVVKGVTKRTVKEVEGKKMSKKSKKKKKKAKKKAEKKE